MVSRYSVVRFYSFRSVPFRFLFCSLQLRVTPMGGLLLFSRIWDSRTVVSLLLFSSYLDGVLPGLNASPGQGNPFLMYLHRFLREFEPLRQ